MRLPLQRVVGRGEGGRLEVVAGGRPWKVDADVGVVVKGRTDLDRGSGRRM